MRSSYDPATSRLELAFETGEELESFVAAMERDLGFMAQLGEQLPLHHPVDVALTSAAGTGEMRARVAQVFDRGAGEYGTAFLVEDAAAARRLLRLPPAAREGGAEAPEEAPEPADPRTSGEMMGTSPIHRIKQMNPNQRAMLAMKASRTERRILLRDKSPQVLQNLLNNPRIDAEEILQIARSSHVVAPILQRIAGDARWSNNQEILAVIARHPKTPSVFASRLLPSLRTSDLRIMAKMSSGLREMVRKAALREYMKRTGQKI